ALAILAALLGAAGSPLGGWLGLIGLLLEGAAFVLFGLGFAGIRARRWIPWLYVIAGALMLVTALLGMVGGGFGAAALFVQFVIAALILVASLLLLSARAGDRYLCIALIVLSALLVLALFVGNIVLTVIIGAVYIVVGILVWGVRLGRRRPMTRRL
ncbi:MAG: hypothetical protein ABUT11_05050, partial [Leifsonia sp.]